MRYKAFRERGYQIGSGVIESTCKHVVGPRCKQASMKWEEQGINTQHSDFLKVKIIAGGHFC